MKKLLTVLLIALLILSAAACAKNTPASSSVDLTQWKTLGDIWSHVAQLSTKGRKLHTNKKCCNN